MFLGVPGAEDEVKLWEQTSLSKVLISDNEYRWQNDSARHGET